MCLFFVGVIDPSHFLLAISGGELYNNKHRKGVVMIHDQPHLIWNIIRLSLVAAVDYFFVKSNN